MDKCGCGKDGKYMHFIGEVEVYSCNKRYVCPTYDDQAARLGEVAIEMMRYKRALEKIVDVNAMDYEYKAWAKQAITNVPKIK